MKTSLKKAVSLMLVFMMCLTVGVPAFAEEHSNSKSHEIILSKPGDVIVTDNGESMDEIKKKAEQDQYSNNNGIRSMPTIWSYRRYITDKHKECVMNLVEPLTEYLENRYFKDKETWPVVTVEKGKQITVGVSVSTSLGVSNDIVSAGLGKNVSTSTTLTTSQSYSYNVRYGESGRIVMKYTRDLYEFTCVKETYLNGSLQSTETAPGDAETKPYKSKVAYQFVCLW